VVQASPASSTTTPRVNLPSRSTLCAWSAQEVPSSTVAPGSPQPHTRCARPSHYLDSRLLHLVHLRITLSPPRLRPAASCAHRKCADLPLHALQKQRPAYRPLSPTLSPASPPPLSRRHGLAPPSRSCASHPVVLLPLDSCPLQLVAGTRTAQQPAAADPRTRRGRPHQPLLVRGLPLSLSASVSVADDSRCAQAPDHVRPDPGVRPRSPPSSDSRSAEADPSPARPTAHRRPCCTRPTASTSPRTSTSPWSASPTSGASRSALLSSRARTSLTLFPASPPSHAAQVRRQPVSLSSPSCIDFAPIGTLIRASRTSAAATSTSCTSAPASRTRSPTPASRATGSARSASRTASRWARSA